MKLRPLLALLALLLSGCGSGPTGQLLLDPAGSPQVGRDLTSDPAINLSVLRNASGVPSGVRVSWTRVDDAEATGYFIYRDGTAIPGGNPAGHEALRVNGGVKIDQSGTGTDTLTFDDNFSPEVGEDYFYRMTVVNTTDDESDFSTQLSITIATQTILTVSQAGGSIGDQVTITGTDFGQTRNGDKVLFRRSTGAIDVEAGSYVSWTPTEIVCTIPYGATDGVVGVQIGAVQVNSTDTISYNEPVLSTVNPTQDWVQNSYITLTGTDFGPKPSLVGNATLVKFGTTSALPADIDETQWTTTQIKVKVPAAAVGMTVSVTVTVGGNVSNGQNFVIQPHIDGLSGTRINGSTLTISGTNFGASQGGGSVLIGSITADIVSWSNGLIAATIPFDVADCQVQVARSDAQLTSAAGLDVIPAIDNLLETKRLIGETLTIAGTGFGMVRGSSKVTFEGGNIDGVNYLAWNSTFIQVEVPAGVTKGKIMLSIVDASVGANQDSAESSAVLRIVAPPTDLTDIGQIQ